jgi:hypothetical protein
VKEKEIQFRLFYSSLEYDLFFEEETLTAERAAASSWSSSSSSGLSSLTTTPQLREERKKIKEESKGEKKGLIRFFTFFSWDWIEDSLCSLDEQNRWKLKNFNKENE